MQLKGCDLIAVMEAWWGRSHDWNVVMSGYVFLGKAGQQAKGVRLLYLREQLEYIELCAGTDEEQSESLWVRRVRRIQVIATLPG